MNGILNLYKPSGITSFSAVSRVRKFCGEKRVGHAGTLDPLACGVLPILVGKAASMQEMLSDHDKTYIAGIRLGTVTDTGDTTGKVLSQTEVNVTYNMFSEAALGFLGKTKQIPPMYSAVQVDGKRLYELARNGIEVERKARAIEIYSLSVIRRENNTDFIFEVSCSKGTYIRTLCEDIGQKLGCGACMFSLERTRCGSFDAKSSVSLETLERLYISGSSADIEKLLIPCETLFSDLPKVRLSEFYTRLCLNGCEIYLSKARIPQSVFSKSLLCAVYGSDGAFLGEGELRDFPDGKAIKLKYRLV